MKALNLTSIGASHIRSGKECQDFSLSDSNERYSYAITCDGHGGDNYFRSAYGSRFAAQAASSCITELLNDIVEGYEPNDSETMLVQLEKSIIARWNAAVWDHYESNPFTEDELAIVDEKRRKRILSGKSIESTYGTTLIALAITEKFWFGIQIGDGKCVRILADGTFDTPIPPNEKCFLNSTTSICDENAIEDFRHCYSEEMPIALFCGSDGIDDSFIRDEQLFKLYATIARSFATSEYDQALAELEDYMPRLSSKGSGDDVSIAGLIDTDCVIDAIGEADEPESNADQKATEETTAAEPEPRVWECPKCGNVCATNYCSECGTKRPEHVKAVESSEESGTESDGRPAIDATGAEEQPSANNLTETCDAMPSKPVAEDAFREETIQIPITGPENEDSAEASESDDNGVVRIRIVGPDEPEETAGVSAEQQEETQSDTDVNDEEAAEGECEPEQGLDSGIESLGEPQTKEAALS